MFPVCDIWIPALLLSTLCVCVCVFFNYCPFPLQSAVSFSERHDIWYSLRRRERQTHFTQRVLCFVTLRCGETSRLRVTLPKCNKNNTRVAVASILRIDIREIKTQMYSWCLHTYTAPGEHWISFLMEYLSCTALSWRQFWFCSVLSISFQHSITIWGNGSLQSKSLVDITTRLLTWNATSPIARMNVIKKLLKLYYPFLYYLPE